MACNGCQGVRAMLFLFKVRMSRWCVRKGCHLGLRSLTRFACALPMAKTPISGLVSGLVILRQLFAEMSRKWRK